MSSSFFNTGRDGGSPNVFEQYSPSCKRSNSAGSGSFKNVSNANRANCPTFKSDRIMQHLYFSFALCFVCGKGKRGTILSRVFEMPDRSGGLNCRVCGRGGRPGGGRGAILPCGHAGRVTLPCGSAGRLAPPCEHAKTLANPRKMLPVAP